MVTYEFESIPASTIRFVAERVKVFPPVAALETAQDRLLEKNLFQELGIPTPPFAPVDRLDDLRSAADANRDFRLSSRPGGWATTARARS